MKGKYRLLTAFFAGAILALLLAPKTGRELRNMLASSGRSAYGTGEKVITPAKKATTAMVGVKEKVKREKPTEEKMEEAA